MNQTSVSQVKIAWMMEPQGQHQANCVPTISIPDNNIEFIETCDSNVYRIVQAGEPLMAQQQLQMQAPTVKHAQFVYNQGGQAQQLILQNASPFQVQHGALVTPQMVWRASPQVPKVLLKPHHLVKVVPNTTNGNIIMLTQSPQHIPVRNIPEFQERYGMIISPDKNCQAKVSQTNAQASSAKPPLPTGPPPLQPPPPITPPQILPEANLAFIQAQGAAPAGHVGAPRQILTTLKPVLIARPSQTSMLKLHDASSPPKGNATATTSASTARHIITAGNKNFNVISSTSCKAIPCAPQEENGQSPVVQTEVPPAEQASKDSISRGCPKLPGLLTKGPVLSVSTTVTDQASVTRALSPATQTPHVEAMRIIPGKVAVCLLCGFSSLDLNKCQRCKRPLGKAKIVDDNMHRPKDSSNQKSSPKILKRAGPSEKVTLSPATPSTSKSKPVEQKIVIGNSPLIIKSKKLVATTLRKAKAVEEPVCLTISDDEDEAAATVPAKQKPAPQTNKSPGENRISFTRDSALCPLIKCKEPSTEQLSQSDDSTLSLGLPESVIENYQKGLGSVSANLKCRTVRIGSYKEVPIEAVLLCPEGLRISMPHPETKVPVVVEVPRVSVSAVLAHLGRAMPVLFIYLNCKAAEKVRHLFGMMDPSKEPYFDPLSSNETHKRITLLPERVSDEAKLVIKRIFSREHGRDAITLLESKEANAILVKASPANPEQASQLAKNKAVESKPAGKDLIREIFVYPKPPIKGGIPITTEDYICLGEEQFLNDAIVDFYLKYLTQTKLSERDQARTHVFSSFFYRRLTTKQLNRKSDHTHEKMNIVEQRHSRVKSWTKNVDIFEKDFIFIPINEHAHWFLAVICFPGLEGPARLCDNQPVSAESLKKATVKVNKAGSPVKQYTIGDTTVTMAHSPSTLAATLLKKKSSETVISVDDSGSERDEAEGDEEEFANSEEEADIEPPKEAEEAVVPEDTYVYPPNAIKQPCILIFDSLSSNSRNRVVATLRDYLRIEYKLKKGKERKFNRDVFRGALPKVPQQNNFTDCGIFMLQYAESFFENPIRDFTLPLKNVRKWFDEETVRGKRESIARLIQQMATEQGVSFKLPELTFTKQLPKDAVVEGVIVAPSGPQQEQQPTSETETAVEPDSVLPDMEVDATNSGEEMVTFSVLVPEEHVLPMPVTPSIDSEVVVSEEPNDSGASIDESNMNQCIEVLNSYFRDDDVEVDSTLNSSFCKRKAEDDLESGSSAKRSC
ncbi:sentrin-specific protease 6-like isoform X2 [Cloeon dipterum]|uniref:sentrin-specific protease 6-like isoform X2 n=1 Tax=Cloeon dipterum TaxID=197152 RepID=UPI00321FF6C1